ncbi:MAG: bifunctional (p)ppGpp synthetase/guanosine-3',5'-bis(diphosphate) 3'-pyrophosphohydrolase [Microbacteriaceae bacterium]|jgi:GTP pyrophosphokinase|nr:bifunctional (p)ppGpp synthetase/guanosine-3',5'-bis(diphosphate) 3'-pyrophosphohydrolase [Microbacteriaceae bacterium]
MADTSGGTGKHVRLPRFFSPKPLSSAPTYRYAFDELVRTARKNSSRADIPLLNRAFQVAEHAHEGQLRHSGEPYITHPVAVAQILADLGIGTTTLAAALLHDTVEDTDYSLAQLTEDFGEEIAMLVDGVTKLDKVKYGDSAQAETVRKMVVAMSKDIRVLVIKLADRLHNARTWQYVPAEKATRKAQETLEIYAPLANRLGISAIQHELEDRSFAVLYPKVYEEIARLVRERQPKRQEYIDKVVGILTEDMRAERIKGRVSGRPKEYYSVYQKMVVRGREFDEIYDLVGIRVIVNTIRECYAVLGAVHARWKPVPGRFKDYIAMPKYNLYQSLHTTVIGPEGRPVEIQIRTEEMHKRAEYGIAAHWKYKADMGKTVTGRAPSGPRSQEDLVWLKNLSDWQSDTKDSREFLDSLRFEIGANSVYVFTPQGKVIGLPQGSTPVDFAYAVHTEVGHRTMGAKLNGRLVPLETELHSGDSVEILTSKSADAGPSKDWLSFVKSPRARSKIKQWFTKERREEAIEQGRDALQRALRKHKLNVHDIIDHEVLSEVAAGLNYDTVDKLYAALGEGHVSTQSVIEKLTLTVEGMEVPEEDEDRAVLSGHRHLLPERTKKSDSGVLVKGQGDMLVKLAKCCTPVPGDDIVGFITHGQGVSVHQRQCHNVKELLKQSDRIIDVSWAPTNTSVFLVHIQVEALDRSGLLSDVTRVLSEHHVNILTATVSTSEDRLAISRFVFEMGDTVHLDRLLNAVRRIDAVYDVYRVSE